MPRRKKSSPFTLFAFQDIITSITGIMILVTLLLVLELVQQVESAPVAQTARLIRELEEANRQLQEEIDRLQYQLAAAADNPAAASDVEMLQKEIQRLQADIRVLQQQSPKLRRRLDHNQDRLRRDRQRLAPRIAQQAKELQQKQKQLSDVETKLKQWRNRVVYKMSPGFRKNPWLVQVEEKRILVAPINRTSQPRRFDSVDQFLQWVKQNRRPDQDFFFLVFKPDGVEHYQQMINQLRVGRFDVGVDILPQDKNALGTQSRGASGP